MRLGARRDEVIAPLLKRIDTIDKQIEMLDRQVRKVVSQSWQDHVSIIFRRQRMLDELESYRRFLGSRTKFTK